MRTLHFLIPGDLESRTGGYEYDRRVIAGLRARGWTVAVHGLDASFPRPTPAALGRAAETLASLPAGATVLVDGLALGAMPGPVAGHAHRLDLLALVHHPLALETGLEPSLAERLRESERRALALVRHVIVTSARTAATLSDYEVPADRITVAVPGTDRGPIAAGSADGTVRLVCVATITPRKGHDVLIQALAPLAHGPWRLTCVGSTSLDPGTSAGMRALVQSLGLGSQVELVGEADAPRTARYYQESDVFVLATWYEGYGMAVAEAIAAGLPVVSTPTGAIPELVGPEAGIMVPAGDVAGWTAALTRVLVAPERQRLTEGARRRRAGLPGWDDTAQVVERALVDHV